MQKIAISSDFSGPAEEIESLVQVVVSLGLTTSESKILRNVALTLAKALTYQSASTLFQEENQNRLVAQNSLVLLEMVVLMIEHWTTAHLN